VENEKLDLLAQQLGLSVVGSSDFHRLKHIGLIRTKFIQSCNTWHDVVTAIKDRQTVPFVHSSTPVELRKGADGLKYLGRLK
jgi:hypothetical protein